MKVAQILTTALGRPIKHRVISREETLAIYSSYGLPKDKAEALVDIELALETGSAERLVTDKEFDVARKVGKVGVKEYVEKNKGLWLK
jgi:hypothetical protein